MGVLPARSLVPTIPPTIARLAFCCRYRLLLFPTGRFVPALPGDKGMNGHLGDEDKNASSLCRCISSVSPCRFWPATFPRGNPSKSPSPRAGQNDPEKAVPTVGVPRTRRKRGLAETRLPRQRYQRGHAATALFFQRSAGTRYPRPAST